MTVLKVDMVTIRFDDIRVVSQGDRDPDAEGVEGMSASKIANDFDSFQNGLPRNFKDAKKLYDDVRKNMNVTNKIGQTKKS